jgi:hypothetical protein
MQDMPTPRDFLCAVPTLEEAQSWVVALQWAASIHQRGSVPGEWEDEEEDLYFTSLQKAGFHHQSHHKPAFQVVRPTKKKMVTRDMTQSAAPTTPSPSQREKKQTPTSLGKMVIPKLQGIQPVRTGGTKVEPAFRIQLLVLNKQRGGSIEEHAILRTARDVESLLENLRALVNGGDRKKTKAVLESISDKVKTLQPLNTYSDFVRALGPLDSILRSLAIDPHICNSQILKGFWGLDNPSGRPQMPLIFNYEPIALVKTIQGVPSATTEALVKEWLQQGTYETATVPKLCLYYILQEPFLLGGAVVLPLILLKPLLFIYSIIPSFKVSLDVLLLSWIATFWLGKYWQKRLFGSEAVQVKGIVQTAPAVHSQVHQYLHVNDVHEGGDDSASHLDVLSLSSEEVCCEDYNLEDELEGSLSPVPSEQSTVTLSSPLPKYPANGGTSCWSKPPDHIFRVRSATYLQDRVKLPSGSAPFRCRGVDIWLTDNPERHIARHPSVLGGRLEEEDTFMVNFLLPFGNFVSYFGIPPIDKFPPKLGDVWTKFIHGDQQYRDARLKLLPVVVDGPWIVKAAVGPGTSPALLGKVIPLQYYFRHPTEDQKGIYEVDVIITASTIAKGILSVVKGHTQALTIAFGFIIEAAEQEELPETVLCNFQMHELNLEYCPQLPHVNMDISTQ